MELKVITRTVLGKKVRALRRKGLVPAEIFGKKMPNRHVSVLEKELKRAHAAGGEHTILTLVTETGEKLPAIISDMQLDPLSGAPLSADFHLIRMDEKLQTKVPLSFEGVAPAAKKGFPVITVLQELEVETLPAHIPHTLTVNLERLEAPGQSIHVADIALPRGVKVLVNPETVIATVTERTKEEAPAPPLAAETETTPVSETGAIPQSENAPPQKKEARTGKTPG